MFEEILVCLDGSKLAEQILPYATEEATRFGSRVTLLEVVTIPPMVVAAEAATATSQTSGLIEETVHREVGEAKTYLEQVAGPLRQQGINIDCVAIEGSPVGNTVIDYARDNAIDLICISTHGHSGLGRIIFGSIADQILRESGLPILVIKPKEIEK